MLCLIGNTTTQSEKHPAEQHFLVPSIVFGCCVIFTIISTAAILLWEKYETDKKNKETNDAGRKQEIIKTPQI